MVVRGPAPGRIAHTRFRSLPEYLEPGDLIVVNTSATVAAAVDGRRRRRIGGGRVTSPAPPMLTGGSSSCATKSSPAWATRRPARPSSCRAGRSLTLARAWPDPTQQQGSRLWEAEIAVESGVGAYLQREGRPIAYDHVRGRWPLSDYQTIFAEHPGSAEMASASRPFSLRLVGELWKAGVAHRAAAAAHRRLLAGGRRASAARALPGARRDGPPGQRGASRRRAHHRRRYDRHAGAGNRCGAGRFGPRRRRHHRSS